jgi:hypothetical protein
MVKWIFPIFVLVSSFCLGGTIDPSVPDQKYLDYAEGFGCVVRIEGVCSCGKDHEYHASAVAISPVWVLTAAHVVADVKDPVVKIGDRQFKVNKIVSHEDFKESKVGYADIAICRCDGDLGLEFYPELYENNNEISKTVSISGYGMSGNFSTGTVRSDKKRRAGSNKVVRIERDVLVCVLSDQKTALEFLIASGDSGGGLFIGNRLAGINSFVMSADGKNDSDYGDECAHTRISKFVPWIKLKMAAKD